MHGPASGARSLQTACAPTDRRRTMGQHMTLWIGVCGAASHSGRLQPH